MTTPHVANTAEAREKEQVGDWESAATAYRAILEREDAGDIATERCRAAAGLARCLLETSRRGQPRDAEDLINEAWALASEADDPELKGEVLLVHATLDERNGRLRKALLRAEEARSLLEGVPSRVAEAEVRLASTERRIGEYNRALERLRSLDEHQLPERLRAEYLDELGAVLLARGDAKAAIEVLERGLVLDEATATNYGAARTQLLLAEAHMRLGEREDAKSLIETTIATYEGAKADAGLSEAYALFGIWYEDIEDFVSAADHFQQSYELDRSSDDNVGQARAKRRLARTYRRRGFGDRARDLLSDARRVLPREEQVEHAALLREEGFLTLHGSDPNYEEAIALFRRALDIAANAGDERLMAISKRDLARAYREDDEPETALALLLEAKVQLKARGDLRELDDLLDDLAEVYLELDENEEAEVCLAASLELDEALGRIDSKGRTLLLFGEVATRKGNVDKAESCYRDALALYVDASYDVGIAEASVCLAEWLLDQRATDEALEHLRRAVDITSRLTKPLGRVRALRLAAAAYRQRGDVRRALELLADARRNLGGIDDPSEHAWVDFEEGRISLATGDYVAAAKLLGNARTVFRESKNPVDDASCCRLMGLSTAYQGRFTEAFELMETARVVLESSKDIPELSELHHDLATVHLLVGNIPEAKRWAERSLHEDGSPRARRRKTKTMLLLARAAKRSDDLETARAFIDDALEICKELRDEVGQTEALIELGDWHVAAATSAEDRAPAITAFKDARRLAQARADSRMSAKCNRKLAGVYLDRSELQRADESLQDSASDLRDVRNSREWGPLEHELGRLHAARNDHAGAITHYHSALERLDEVDEESLRGTTYRYLIASHQIRGDAAAALRCIRDAGTEDEAVYGVMIQALHPMIMEAAEAPFLAGNHRDSVVAAFGRLESEFKERSMRDSDPPPVTAHVSKHIRAALNRGRTDLPRFDKPNSIAAFEDFCLASFDLIRNHIAHNRRPTTAGDTFSALAVAHWIARQLDPSQYEQPQSLADSAQPTATEARSLLP